MQVSAAVSAVAGGVAAAGWLARSAWRATRRLGHAIDDVLGEQARPGVAPRPGMIARLAAIEAEMQPNSGTSLRDAVDRVEARQIRTDQRLDQHLTVHDKT